MKTNNTLYRSSWRIWITKRLLTVTPMNCTGGNRWRRHDSCLPASRSRPSRWMRAKKWPERDNATCKNNTPIKRWIKGVFVDSLLSPVFLLTDGITLTGGLCVRNYITRWICLIPPPRTRTDVRGDQSPGCFVAAQLDRLRGFCHHVSGSITRLRC